jgi:hypothetical protein
MADLQFVVLKVDNIWTVLCDNFPLGRYQHRTSAINAASRLARDAHRLGKSVELLSQDLGGELSAHPIDVEDRSPQPPPTDPSATMRP